MSRCPLACVVYWCSKFPSLYIFNTPGISCVRIASTFSLRYVKQESPLCWVSLEWLLIFVSSCSVLDKATDFQPVSISILLHNVQKWQRWTGLSFWIHSASGGQPFIHCLHSAVNDPRACPVLIFWRNVASVPRTKHWRSLEINLDACQLWEASERIHCSIRERDPVLYR
jgi:hypothetical protein